MTGHTDATLVAMRPVSTAAMSSRTVSVYSTDSRSRESILVFCRTVAIRLTRTSNSVRGRQCLPTTSSSHLLQSRRFPLPTGLRASHSLLIDQRCAHSVFL